MAKKRKADDYDSPWKDALQVYLQAFLAFFFPDIRDDIDWKRGYESLDKEFQRISRRAKVGKRLADKLFKVWLKDGSERWLLVHIEIQGAVEPEFPQRMFDYNVAAYRLYNQTVASLAVLCDEDPEWRPKTFRYEQWGASVILTFRMAKLLDYVEATKDLNAATNPFAAVVQAHWAALQTRNDPNFRGQEKRRLVKSLYLGNWTKDDIRQLFGLIDWLMTLPEDLEEAFQTEMFAFEEEKKVKYVTSVERRGIKIGMEKGMELGRKEMLLDLIGEELESRFGNAGKKLVRKAQALTDLKSLRDFHRFLKTASNLEDVRGYLTC